MFTPFTVEPDEDPAQAVLKGYLLMLEADHYLDTIGLSWAGVIDALRDIDAEAALAPEREYIDATGYLDNAMARHYALSWWAHGLSVEQVATLIGKQRDNHDQLVAELDKFLNARPNVANERVVLELHRLGMSPGDIAIRLGMRRNNVDNALKRLSIKPKLKQPRIVQQIRAGVIYDRNKGATYPDLRRKYNLTTNQVRSILRHANNKGLLKNYGEDQADAS